MWITQKMAQKDSTELLGEGTVTIGGQSPAVDCVGEQRGMDIYAPGGYYWYPGDGDDVLTSGASGRAVIGRLMDDTPEGLEPGEVYIKSKSGAGICLRADGSIEIHGDVSISGSLTINGNTLEV